MNKKIVIGALKKTRQSKGRECEYQLGAGTISVILIKESLSEELILELRPE